MNLIQLDVFTHSLFNKVICHFTRPQLVAIDDTSTSVPAQYCIIVAPRANRFCTSREIAAWTTARNEAGARIRWMFTVERAREKLGRAYAKCTTEGVDAAA